MNNLTKDQQRFISVMLITANLILAFMTATIPVVSGTCLGCAGIAAVDLVMREKSL